MPVHNKKLVRKYNHAMKCKLKKRNQIQEAAERRGFRERTLRIFPACQYCLIGLTLDTSTVDHIIPVSQKGKDEESNWAISCRRCNGKKGNKRPDQIGTYLRWSPDADGVPILKTRSTYNKWPMTRRALISDINVTAR